MRLGEQLPALRSNGIPSPGHQEYTNRRDDVDNGWAERFKPPFPVVLNAQQPSSCSEAIMSAEEARGRLGELIAFAQDRFPRVVRKKGEIIYHKGDPPGRLWLLEDGTAKLFSRSEAGKILTFQFLDAPDVLGDLAILDGGPQHTSAEALTDCSLIAIPKDQLQNMVYDNHALNLLFLGLTAQRLRAYLQLQQDMVFYTGYERVRLFLARWKSDEINLSQREIAEANGLTRAFAAEELKRLCHTGAISQAAYRRIKILNREKLL